MTTDYIIDVSEEDFEYQVLTYSQQTPVVVDFWAPWCAPCRVLGPLLEKLAQEGQGSFRLAKVNVDENPKLAQRYNVRSIPVVKAFRDGHPVAEFSGTRPEPQVREFIRAIAPSQSELALEKAQSMLEMQQARSAERIFREVLEKNPGQPAAQLGLAKSLLLLGRPREAQGLLRNFPASREFTQAEILRPLADASVRLEDGPSLAGSENPLDAAFENALRLVRRGNVEAALDGLLDILRQDKRYRSGEPRLVFVGLLELLGESNPQTRQYRNELAAVLF